MNNDNKVETAIAGLNCWVSYATDSTKAIRFLAVDFHELMVDLGFALINYHLIEIPSS